MTTSPTGPWWRLLEEQSCQVPGISQMYLQQAQWVQGQAFGSRPHAPPPSIMQQLRDKAEELRANLAKVKTWEAELAQCERMLAAAEEAPNG